MRITIIHPSRSRPEKSKKTIQKWFKDADRMREVIVSLDDDDPFVSDYKNAYQMNALVSKNRSCVDAINNAAKLAEGDILMVVSDDTDCFPGWDTALLKVVEGKTDWILKTDDDIQDWIITLPIMDRAYYNRFGYIYHPDYTHMFADTYMTAVADITGRKIKSKLLFKHLHPGHSGGKEMPDALNRRNDLTWMQGQDTFIRLMNQFSKEDIRKVEDRTMINWFRQHGVLK